MQLVKVKGKCEHEFPKEGLVRRGLYVYQLEWWLKHFPPEQLLVLNHEEVWTSVDGWMGMRKGAIRAPCMSSSHTSFLRAAPE